MSALYTMNIFCFFSMLRSPCRNFWNVHLSWRSSFNLLLGNMDVWNRIVNSSIIKIFIWVTSNRTSLIVYPKRFSWTCSIVYWSGDKFKLRVEFLCLASFWPFNWLSLHEILFLVFNCCPRRLLLSWIILLSFLPCFSFITFCQAHATNSSMI